MVMLLNKKGNLFNVCNLLSYTCTSTELRNTKVKKQMIYQSLIFII